MEFDVRNINIPNYERDNQKIPYEHWVYESEVGGADLRFSSQEYAEKMIHEVKFSLLCRCLEYPIWNHIDALPLLYILSLSLQNAAPKNGTEK